MAEHHLSFSRMCRFALVHVVKLPCVCASICMHMHLKKVLNSIAHMIAGISKFSASSPTTTPGNILQCMCVCVCAGARARARARACARAVCCVLCVYTQADM